ncbi:MAG: ATP-binding protein [Ignavibacteriae bacterium]|nr:ATP-binding protein [Ignavibacteriota bacterium]
MKTEKGKAKFLKHICALSNSNPENDSFLIVGISNDNEIVGAEFIDDADIQNLVNSILKNPPLIKYENVSFPNLKKDKSVGLLTIRNNSKTTSFLKKISTIEANTIYHRIGSKSEPTNGEINKVKENKEIVEKTYKFSQINIKDLLDNVFDFYNLWDKAYNPTYIVFKDQFVVCWAGYSTNDDYLSEVDIQIVNEGTRLFFSAIQEVKMNITNELINIIEFQRLGFGNNFDNYATHSNSIIFKDNGTYSINKQFIFTPPQFPIEDVERLYEKAKKFENRIKSNEKMDIIDWEFGEGLANYYFLCYLNGIKEARQDFINSIEYLDGVAALWHRECNDLLEEYEKNYC